MKSVTLTSPNGQSMPRIMWYWGQGKYFLLPKELAMLPIFVCTSSTVNPPISRPVLRWRAARATSNKAWYDVECDTAKCKIELNISLAAFWTSATPIALSPIGWEAGRLLFPETISFKTFSAAFLQSWKTFLISPDSAATFLAANLIASGLKIDFYIGKKN